MPPLLVLVALAIIVWSLIELVQADPREVRRLPKPVWAIVIVLVPFGAVLWWLFGRPKAGVPGGQGRTAGQAGVPGWGASRARPQRPAPDDDPDFLRHLREQAEQQRKLRLLEEGEKKRKSDPDPDGPDEDGQSNPA